MNIFAEFFNIKKLQRKAQDLEIVYAEADLESAKIENKLIALEKPEVQEYLRHEFALNRAIGYRMFTLGIPYKSPKTEEIMELARTLAKLSKEK